MNILRCPNCTNSLEELFPMFYRCANCPTVFMILRQDQIEASNEIVEKFPKEFQQNAMNFFNELSKKESEK